MTIAECGARPPAVLAPHQPRTAFNPGQRALQVRPCRPSLLQPIRTRSPTLGQSEIIFLIVFSLIFPPLGVFMMRGLSLGTFINAGLCLLGYLPAQIHALWMLTLTVRR